MSEADRPQRHSKGLLRLLVPLLGSDLIEILVFVVRLANRTFKFKSHEGIYEVLDYHVQLELVDTKGKHAVLHKRQKVRFIQNNIIAYQDKAWGDGDIFADYRCSPGVRVDTYREGHRYNILISLRETKHAGDIEEFRIERTIHDGFTRHVEDFQIDIDHRTRNFTLSAIFPQERQPKTVSILEQNSTRSQELGAEHWVSLPDGRREVKWRIEKPRLFEAYILRWEW